MSVLLWQNVFKLFGQAAVGIVAIEPGVFRRVFVRLRTEIERDMLERHETCGWKYAFSE